MRRAAIAFSISIGTLGICQNPAGVELARVDVSAPVTRPPNASTVRFTALPGNALDGAKSPPILTAVYLSVQRDKSVSHQIELTNVSSQPVSLPVSRDGRKAYEVCTGHRIVESFISHLPRGEEPSKGTVSAELYGCESFKGSLVTLRPGESIELIGVVNLGSLTLDPVPEAMYLVSDETFTGEGNSLQSVGRQELAVPVRMEEAFQSEPREHHGIDGSEPSLISALRDPDSQVRTTAAYKLASGHFPDAVPAVEQALAEEKDKLARVGLATALVSLHDPLGIAFLQERCADAREPIRSAIVATQEIQLYGASPSGCVASMVERLEDPSSADYRDALIPLVASLYPSATKAQATMIVSSLQRMLTDKSQQAYVRMAAGHGLAQIGLPSSLPFIEEALSTETDEVMRSAFMSDRDALHKAGNP